MHINLIFLFAHFIELKELFSKFFLPILIWTNSFRDIVVELVNIWRFSPYVPRRNMVNEGLGHGQLFSIAFPTHSCCLCICAKKSSTYVVNECLKTPNGTKNISTYVIPYIFQNSIDHGPVLQLSLLRRGN